VPILNAKSLRWNASANFLGLAYTIIIGISVFPLYLQYLGAEAFGLVGFFMLLQSWMQLLDMGMSPMLSRQAAQARAQRVRFVELKKLLRSLELIFLLFSLVVVLAFVFGSEWVATSWLTVEAIPLSAVRICVVLMGGVIGVRLFTSLYRSGIQGLENQVWLNASNIVFVTMRFVGALLILQFLTQDIVTFFLYQLAISVVELAVLAVILHRSMPVTDHVGVGFYWDVLKPMLPFAGGLAYSVWVWILITQVDKVILSTILPLSEYGYFALVAIVAAGILQIGSPISQAILPRMTYLLSQDNEEGMLRLYRMSTRLMLVIMLPLVGVIAMFSTELLFAWTGDKAAAEWAGPVLFWFALGNGILAINAFQYYLQFAHGNLRIHVIYNTVSVIIQIPIIIYVAFEYGALGVAQAWFALRLIAFIVWTPIVHHVYAPGIHFSWLRKDIAPAFLRTGFLLALIRWVNVDFDSMDRIEIFSTLLGLGILVFGINAAFSVESRKFATGFIQMIRPK